MTKLLIVAVFATCLAMAMAYYPKYCDDPETPDHGGFKPDRKVHALKDRVDFYCKNRYRLVGAKSAVCTYDRETGKIGWSNPSPKCVGELRSRLSFFMSCHHCLSVYSILMRLFCIISSFLLFYL